MHEIPNYKKKKKKENGNVLRDDKTAEILSTERASETNACTPLIYMKNASFCLQSRNNIMNACRDRCCCRFWVGPAQGFDNKS